MHVAACTGVRSCGEKPPPNVLLEIIMSYTSFHLNPTKQPRLRIAVQREETAALRYLDRGDFSPEPRVPSFTHVAALPTFPGVLARAADGRCVLTPRFRTVRFIRDTHGRLRNRELTLGMLGA